MNNKQVIVSKPHSAFTNLEDEINNRIQDGYEPSAGLTANNAKDLIQMVERKDNRTISTYKIVLHFKDPQQANEVQRRLTQEIVNEELKNQIAKECKDGYSTLGDIVPVFEPKCIDYINGRCFAYQAMIKKIRKSPSNFK